MFFPSTYPSSRSPCRKASMRSGKTEGEVVRNPIRGTFVGCCASAIAPHTAEREERLRKAPAHFRFWIPRRQLPSQAWGLSLSKAGQVSGSRLSEQEKPNRIRNVLFMYFPSIGSWFRVPSSGLNLKPETRNLKPFKLASTDTSHALAIATSRYRGSRECRKRSCS